MASRDHCAYCFDVLLQSFDKNAQTYPPQNKHDLKFPMFITWKKHNGDEANWKLRGCIGTFSPHELVSGLKKYALTSAFKDTRFCAVSKPEVAFLKCDVSLLTNFQKGDSVDDWKVGSHGISIEFSDPHDESLCYSATYLPEVASEQGWTREQTLSELIIKSGYTKTQTSALRKRISLTRYESSKSCITYSEYKRLRVNMNMNMASHEDSKYLPN